MAEKQTYPMISEKNWWDLRNQFKKTIPASVNPSYLSDVSFCCTYLLPDTFWE